jgi:hypothetical protein
VAIVKPSVAEALKYPATLSALTSGDRQRRRHKRAAARAYAFPQKEPIQRLYPQQFS